MTFQVTARMRRMKKNRKKSGKGVIEVLYSDDMGASRVSAVPVKVPTKIIVQGISILDDDSRLKRQKKRCVISTSTKAILIA